MRWRTYEAWRSIVMTWLQPAVVSMLAINLALCRVVLDVAALPMFF